MRLVTYVDVDDTQGDGRVSVHARHELEVSRERGVLLLDDRGWGSNARWTDTTVPDVEFQARTVVGPDEPFDTHTREQMAADHWRDLANVAQSHGVVISPSDLRALPHDVVLSERLLSRLNTRTST